MLAACAYDTGSCIATMQPEPNVQQAKQLLGIPIERGVHAVLGLG
jgi:hypothetical protein